MPAANDVLLPICVALSLLGVIVTGVAWRQRRTGRVIQGVGLVIAPVALYLTKLLDVVWDFVVGVVAWAGRLAFSPPVWIGLGLLGVAVVLWVVGGLLAKRSAVRRKADPTVDRSKNAPAVGTGKPRATASAASTKTKKGTPSEPADPEMAEIEALLKSRGID